MPTIYDLFTAPELVSYWETVSQGEAPFLGAELFPQQKQIGLEFKWLKGKTGVPKALRPSEFDADVIPRGREGFEEMIQDMAFFKESKYIDEKTRQELFKVLKTNDQAYIDAVSNHVFADVAELISAAESRKEIMRMQALTTGTVALTIENGNEVKADYEIPENQKVDVATSWDDVNADITEDLESAIEVLTAKGATPARILLNSVTLGKMRKNNIIKANLIAGDATNKRISKADVIAYLQDEFKLQVAVYDKVYNDGNGVQKFVQDGVVVLMPEGDLGKTHLGTTPEEADLMSQADTDAQVSIVNQATAVTTMKKKDPVTVETKVSMITFPSFEAADKVFILNTLGEGV